MWGMLIAAGVSLASGAMAGNAAEKAARGQVKKLNQEREMTLFSAELENAFALGEAEASSYASGIQMSGSNERYINDLSSAAQRNIQSINLDYDTRIQTVLAGGQATAKNARLGGISGAIGQGINMYNAGAAGDRRDSHLAKMAAPKGDG